MGCSTEPCRSTRQHRTCRACNYCYHQCLRNVRDAFRRKQGCHSDARSVNASGSCIPLEWAMWFGGNLFDTRPRVCKNAKSGMFLQPVCPRHTLTCAAASVLVSPCFVMSACMLDVAGACRQQAQAQGSPVNLVYCTVLEALVLVTGILATNENVC